MDCVGPDFVIRRMIAGDYVIMAETKNGQVSTVPLNQIRENPVALRAVDKRRREYAELVESIRTKGILNPISVREVKDPETGKMVYSVIDGLHRFTAAGDAGLKEIPVYVKNMADAEVWEAQVVA